MKNLDRLIENNYNGANGVALRMLDILELQDDMIQMQEKLENTQYLLENAEDWIDNVVDVTVEKELGAFYDSGDIDNLTHVLKMKLKHKALELVDGI